MGLFSRKSEIEKHLEGLERVDYDQESDTLTFHWKDTRQGRRKAEEYEEHEPWRRRTRAQESE